MKVRLKKRTESSTYCKWEISSGIRRGTTPLRCPDVLALSKITDGESAMMLKRSGEMGSINIDRIVY